MHSASRPTPRCARWSRLRRCACITPWLAHQGDLPAVQPQPTAACAERSRQWLSLCSKAVGLILGQMPAMTRCKSGAQVEDGAVLELAIRLPPAWPLKPADVECRRKVSAQTLWRLLAHNLCIVPLVQQLHARHMPELGPSSHGVPKPIFLVSCHAVWYGREQVGVSEGRLRKWLLSISAFLRNQNGSILDAMSLWKANVDQTFQVRRKQSWRNRHSCSTSR